jgi:hypothetical protein
MDIVLVGSVILVATICATIDSADAQPIGSAREGRRLAHAVRHVWQKVDIRR